MSRLNRVLAFAFFTTISASLVLAQPGPGRGQWRGPGRGPGFGRGGPGADARFVADREVFHFLLANHQQITRKVTNVEKGVETLTESKDSKIAAKLKEHVHWMEERIKKPSPIRMRDPLFRELFQHTDQIKMVVEETDHGLQVTETSDDPYVAKLIQAHAKAVSGFVAKGFEAAHKNHAVPKRDQ